MIVDCKYMVTPTLIHLMYMIVCLKWSIFLVYKGPIAGGILKAVDV